MSLKCISTNIFEKKENNIFQQKIKNLNEKKYNYSKEDLIEVANIINNSRKPVAVLGQGALNSIYELKSFINKNSIPFHNNNSC